MRPSALPIEERIEQAAQHAVRARLFFEIWFYLESAENERVRLNALNQFSAFFLVDWHAHLVAFVVYIYGLFEARNDTINLKRLKREMKDANRLSQTDLIEIDELFEQAAPIVKKVKCLRHEAIAHRTASMSYNDVFQSADVAYNELCRLTRVGLEIVNHFLRAISRKEERFHPSPLSDLKALVELLAKP